MRFTLRILLLGIALFSVWLFYSVDGPRRQSSALTAIRKLVPHAEIYRANEGEERSSHGNRFVRYWLGDDFYEDIVLVDVRMSEVDERVIREIAKFPKLKSLSLGYNPKVTDETLSLIGDLTNLELLDLAKTSVSDGGLMYLKNMHKLTSLSLGGTGVSDKGSQELAHLNNLEILDLDDCKVGDGAAKVLAELPRIKNINMGSTALTDVGLRDLAKCKTLERLTISQSKVTRDGVTKMRADIPGIKIAAVFGNEEF